MGRRGASGGATAAVTGRPWGQARGALPRIMARVALPLLLLSSNERAAAQVTVPLSGAVAVAAAAAQAANGTLDDPHVFAFASGSFDQLGGDMGGSYASGEDAWFRIAPCEEGDCQVLLWFSTFATELGVDKLTIYDGVNPPASRLDGSIVDLDCTAFTCLAQLSGNSDAATPFSEVKTTEVIVLGESPMLLRSSSAGVWVHWESSDAVEYGGWKLNYKTDRSSDAMLRELRLSFPAAAGGGSLAATPLWDPRNTLYVAQLPREKTSIEVTIVTSDDIPWADWVVSHPASRAGEVLAQVEITVNGLPYSAGMEVDFDMELILQPLVIEVRAMDRHSFLDYVVEVSPNARDLEEDDANADNSNYTAPMLKAAVRPPAPRVRVGGSAGWVASNIYGATIQATVGDYLYFSIMTGTSLMLMEFPECPTPYQGTALATHLDSPFELELDEPGTFYFAGGSEADCQAGQKVVVEVAPSLNLELNDPASATNLTTLRIYGMDLPPIDQPWITGTQWDTEVVWSLVGWDGFNAWYKFHAHHSERFSTKILLGDGLYYARANVWDAELNLLNVSDTDFATEWTGVRTVEVDWQAPETGEYYLSARLFLIDGLRYGNYTVSLQSDWVDPCVSNGYDCGPHGACEVLEGAPGVFRPKCICRDRYTGEECELEPAPPMSLVLSVMSVIDGAATPEIFRTALAKSIYNLEPSSIAIDDFSQRFSGFLNLPGDPWEWDPSTNEGRLARSQVEHTLIEVFKHRMGCGHDLTTCDAKVLNVTSFLDAHGTRKGVNYTAVALGETPRATDPTAGATGYWPDPSHDDCHEYRCYDPNCTDTDVTAWQPWGLELNPFQHGTDACDGGVEMFATGGSISFVPGNSAGSGYNQDCYFRLQCPLSHVAQLTFTSLETEIADRVYVINGADSSTGTLLDYGGLMADIPATTDYTYRTTVPIMTVRYTSDAARASAGFSADYSCVLPLVPSPPPPLWQVNCQEMVHAATTLGMSCSDSVSIFVDNQAAAVTLNEVCPASCGVCLPYLGAPSSIVAFELHSQLDVSDIVTADSFTQVLADGMNSVGSQLQAVWGFQGTPRDLTPVELTVKSVDFLTQVDYVVTVARSSSAAAKVTSKAVQHLLTYGNGTLFTAALNKYGGGAILTQVRTLEINPGDADVAAALAELFMADSARLSAAAADTDGTVIRWNTEPDVVSFEANFDAVERVYQTVQAQRDAHAASEALIAAGDALGANGLTSVARAAEAAEKAAASVLGMDLQKGENIQSGFESYVHDVHRTARIAEPDNSGIGHSGPIGTERSDYSQFGDSSQAAIAAAVGAAAARLVAEGADDAHPLDRLAPILSQAPSSQSYSDDPELPSSTSRFSAQTATWWIPDYLPGGRPPEQPDPPLVVRYSDDTVDITWDTPFDWSIPIKGYVVEMRSCAILYETQSASECDGLRTDYEPVFPTHQGTDTFHSIPNLDAGRMYFFHVRAYNMFDSPMSPNNYGVFSYDSLAVTTWRVPDKIDPPVPHKVQCFEPSHSGGAVVESLDSDSAVGVFEAARFKAKANCTIQLSWVQPFSGAVDNPLVDRSVDVHNNDIINYRIFYLSTPPAPPVSPEPPSFVDKNGHKWIEVPHPPDLSTCATDYTQACPEGWSYHEDVEYGVQVCTQHDNTSPASSMCGSPQIFDEYSESDRMEWESVCNAKWAQTCTVATETTVHGLEDTTEYYFIVNAVNLGRPGAVEAPYHPSVAYGDGVAIHGNQTSEVGAGFVRKQPARKVYPPGSPYVQVYGEGDFSEPSHINSVSVRVGQRVLARDRRGRLSVPESTINPNDMPPVYEGTTVKGRDGTPAGWAPMYHDEHSTFDGPVELEGVWYFPAVVTTSNSDGSFEVVYDEHCPDSQGRMRACTDVLTRNFIDTLGQGSLVPGAVTWRVPDAPAAPMFGTITETSVEVHWNPPSFDGNTNHEMLYADPADTASGGVVLGYRLFVQRYDDTSGIREEWQELDISYLGTNTTHVVPNLDADVVYIFTVISINIVGDSAHSQEAEAPITLEAPIPDESVAATLRPLCPEIQPRKSIPAPHKLACTNLPSTLLATTAGGGTNPVYGWSLWQEYEEITEFPAVYSTEHVWVEYPVYDQDVVRALVLNGRNVTVFENNSGIESRMEILEVLTTNMSHSSNIRREQMLDMSSGGNDCCTLKVPDGDYVLQLNASNTRGAKITEEIVTLKKCGCMDIFNSEFDASARHHAPFMCDSHTFEGAEKMASEGEFVYYEQHLSDSVFAVEISMVIESGNVDVYTSIDGTPALSDHAYDTVYYNVSAVDHSIIAWEYRVPFNILMVAPEPGVRGHQQQFIDVPKSLYVGVYGDDDFSRYSIRTRNVKFQEDRINLPDWEASNDMVETGRYKFYELHFSEAAGDMDVKVSVQCKVGNLTVFVAKKDKYPSEFRTYTQTATTAAGGLAEVIDTWNPEEDRVVFIAVRGNEGGFAEGYPHEPTTVNEFIITARSYRYRAESVLLPALPKEIMDVDGNETVSSETAVILEDERYTEVVLDNFNFYELKFSDEAYAIEVHLSVTFGVVDLYSNFDLPPTQGRYYQRAAGLYDEVAVTIPFDAVNTGIGSVFIGVFGRETDYSNYKITVRELRFSDAPNDPLTLTNGTWVTGLTNFDSLDGYKFYRSYVGPEDTPMGHNVRSGPGSRADSPSADPTAWGDDWQEEWVQTWSEQHRDEYDFDVYATVTVNVHPFAVDEDADEGDLTREEEERVEVMRELASGVDLYASLDWKYPSMERARDAEVHRIGGTGEMTVATLTVPVWTYYGRTLNIGVKTEYPEATYDINVEYTVQFQEEVTSPLDKAHKACPTVSVPLAAGGAVSMEVPCNGHGSCVSGRCICETGFFGLDCGTVPFSESPSQPHITLLSPSMGHVVRSAPVNLSFSVQNALVPADARVLLYVDGQPYPKERSNVMSDLTDLRLFGLYRGRHTAMVVLTANDGTTLTADTVHFVVESPGGCANDCSGRGICMDGPAGQYCICNDGFVGVDCSSDDLWRSGQAFGGVAGSGLAADLVRHLEETVAHGVQQTELEMVALQISMESNDASVLGRRDAAERAMNGFRNQLESDMSTFQLEHESMLNDLYRNRDRLHRTSEAQSEALRRTITKELEGHHSTARSLDAERHRVQNRMDRSKRSHDMRFALMSDEFEYANHKLAFQVDSIRSFDKHATRIDDIAPSDCSQDVNGQWTCFFANAAKDCESGDVIRWNSQEEATKYPVQCRPSEDGAGVSRPFSYQVEAGSEEDTRPQGQRDLYAGR